MIKGITGSCGIRIPDTGILDPHISMNCENPIQGMIRLWGSNYQVFDGNGWKYLPSAVVSVTLDAETLSLLDWAKKKRIEEEVLLTLPSDNPAVKLAIQNVNRIKQELARAEEQLKITEILSQNQ